MRKIVTLIRHAQSTFNAAFDRTGIDPLDFDSRLSSVGRRQIASAREALTKAFPHLVVTSPLTRAVETALGLFGGHAPILVEALHRERLSNSCDVGRSPSLLCREFPSLAFDHLDDPWWYDGWKDTRGVPIESDEAFFARVAKFREWLIARPESMITIVGHGTFLFHLTGRHLANCECLEWHL